MAAAFRCCWRRRRSSRHSVSLVARWRLRYLRQARTRARQTCSRVICGFSPPELRRVQTDERQGYQAQRHMTFQRHITASLKVGQTGFCSWRRGTHVPLAPSARTRPRAPAAGPMPRGVCDEVLDLPRLPIPRHDQSVSRSAVVSQRHVHGLRLPHRRRAGLLIDTERLRCPFFHARQGKYAPALSAVRLRPGRHENDLGTSPTYRRPAKSSTRKNPGLPPYHSSNVSQSNRQPLRSVRASNSSPICHFDR